MLNSTVEDIQKLIKKETGISLLLGNDESLHKEKIPFGVINLDAAIGGGLLRNRSYLIVGDFSSGKTFLSQMLIKSTQEKGGIAAYIDAEQVYDRDWFKQSGIDVDNLLVSQCSIGEKITDVVENLLKAQVDLIVIDSLAAMIPTSEIEEDADKMTMALQARLINKAFRKWTVANSNSVLFGINQTRSGIGGYGPQENYPGGRGQSFFASAIFRTHRGGWITEEKKRIGFELEVTLAKSKICPPQQTVMVPFRFDVCQLDIPSVIAQMAIDLGVISHKGLTYEFGEHRVVGMANLVEMIKTKNLQEELQKLIGAK